MKKALIACLVVLSTFGFAAHGLAYGTSDNNNKMGAAVGKAMNKADKTDKKVDNTKADTKAEKKNVAAQPCPVVGNANSKIYHIKGGRSYEKMLKESKTGDKNRQCFRSEKEAEKAGFKKSKV